MKNSDNKTPQRGRALRALIAEDEPLDADLMATILKRVGYSVESEVVNSPAEFQSRLKQADYDVILADYNLGTWNAMDALEILHATGKDIPLVVVTGSLGDEAAVECIKQGATDYVLKHRMQRLPVVVDSALRDKAQRAAAARLEEQVRRGKREWELTFDCVPDPILLLNANGAIVRANRPVVELAERKFSDMIGRLCWEVMPCADENAEKCPHLTAMETMRFSRRDTLVRVKDRLYECTANPLRDHDGNLSGSVIVLHDLTERRRAEEQLRQAAKMEAIGRLAGGVAHDFNNLLTVINGYGGLLLNRIEEGSSSRRYAEEVCRAGDRAASLTRQLLTFSRQQILEPRVLDLNSVVANVDKMLRRVIGEDISLAVTLAPGLGSIRADPSQLEQVLLNLAVNARDAMPQGGKLTIETSCRQLSAPPAEPHGGLSPGPYVMMKVSDTGCGMSAEAQSHLFEPFFTTKEQGKGTGLGLAMVYGIVKQSGGFVSVASEEGKGTTFQIYFPQVDQPAEPQEACQQAMAMARGSETILVVEDEERVRSLVHSVLEASGYEVLDAQHGQEALAIVQTHPHPVQLVVTDVVLPEMSGPELVAQLAPLKRGLKVLYMSGYTQDAVQVRGLISQGMPYLQKPFTPEKLTHRVREVLDAARVAS